VSLARRLRLNAPGRQLPDFTLSNEAGERGNRSGTPFAMRAGSYSTLPVAPRRKSASICSLDPPPKRAR
jgi:hypothetical protein